MSHIPFPITKLPFCFTEVERQPFMNIFFKAQIYIVWASILYKVNINTVFTIKWLSPGIFNIKKADALEN